MNLDLKEFTDVVAVDTEYRTDGIGKPIPVCLVSKSMATGEVNRSWLNEGKPDGELFPVPDYALVITFFASAELRFLREIGVGIPENIIDLYVEFRNHVNGIDNAPHKLIEVLEWYGLSYPDLELGKDGTRDLILDNEVYSNEEKGLILEYCAVDTSVTLDLFQKMFSEGHIDLQRALLRGRYCKAVAKIETRGVPANYSAFERLKKNCRELEHVFLNANDSYGFYENGVLKRKRVLAYALEYDIPWPTTADGITPRINEDTLYQLKVRYPNLKEISELCEMKQLQKDLKGLSGKLAIYPDGRNRYFAAGFKSKTGRNQPNGESFWTYSKWMRGLITPPEGMALAYLDWGQQEIGIAAKLSGDKNMIAAYKGGDAYLAFAKQAGAVPPDATKESHPEERKKYKETALGTLFGKTAYGISDTLSISFRDAEKLLRDHKRVYHVFWEWIEQVRNQAYFTRKISTLAGWNLNVSAGTKANTLLNFPMQANGAEMLRFAVINADAVGVNIVAMVHDALLIEAPVEGIDKHIELTVRAMNDASSVLLDGLELHTDVEVIMPGERFVSGDALDKWNEINKMINDHIGE